MTLKNMALTKEDRDKRSEPYEVSQEDTPAYPYGLRIGLDDESLDKIDMADLPSVGETLTLTAKVQVVSVSEHENAGSNKRRSVDLQITDMSLDAPASKPDAASILYEE